MKTKLVLLTTFLVLQILTLAEEHLNLSQKEFKKMFYTSNDTLYLKSDSSVYRGYISIYKTNWLFRKYKYSTTKYGHADYQWYEDTIFYKTGEVRMLERKYIQRVYPNGEYHWLYDKTFLSKNGIRSVEMLFVDSTLTISEYYSDMTPISYYKLFKTKEGTCGLYEDYYYNIEDSNGNYVSNNQRIYWGRITYLNHKWHGYYDFKSEKGNLIQKMLYIKGKWIGTADFEEVGGNVVSVKLARKYKGKDMLLKDKVELLNKFAMQINECNLKLDLIVVTTK